VATFSLPVFVVLMVKAEFLVQILMGRPESSAAVLVVVLACGNIISASTGPTSYVISMIGKPGINLMNSVVAIGLYAGLGFWLVPRHGALGMAFVDALVTALINITRVIQVKRLVGIQPFGRSFLKPVTAALVTAFSLMVWTVSPGQGNVNEAIGIIVAGAVYLGVLAILGLDAEERHVFNRIKSRLYAIGKSGS
jgi:O-antigen/teichoic acid export membrane protein